MLDEAIFFRLNGLAGQSNFLDWLIIFLADYLGWVIIAVLVFYLAYKKNFRTGFEIFGASIAAWIVAQIIKLLYHSPRPFLVLENANQLLVHGGFDSFPSGHAAFFFALAAGTWFLNKRLGAVFFVGAILISLARVASGIHWPSDILAGAVFGITIAWSVNWFAKSNKVG